MIYLDNAATTWPKPETVIAAMGKCLREYGANPGRGGHKLSLAAARVVAETRRLVADLINAEDPMQVIFTANATMALNLAIKGLLLPGDHVIISSMEHNSVVRPLRVLEEQGVLVSRIRCLYDGTFPIEELMMGIRENTRLIILTHVSNVTGTVMPIAEVGAIAKEQGIVFLVDAAQSMGILPVDVQEMHIDLLAFPGHKGLLGPQGTGGLYVRPGLNLRPLYEGGTGSQSESPWQPDVLPDRYESGTLNTVGLAGLGAGIKFLLERQEEIRQWEGELTARLLQGLKQIPGVHVYGKVDDKHPLPVVSINIKQYDPAEVAVILDQVFGIACRSGLHCAPAAHQTIGTLANGGTVRLSPGFFNTTGDIDQTLTAIAEIASKA
ncbi:MAG: aminotransferase class V-fold PLP-dependent enzyme [bacterium]